MAVDIDTTIVDTILGDLSQASIDNFAPKWISKDFLEKHLQSFFNDKQINIINFEVKPATAKGENYASYLYRVKVIYTDELQNCKSANNLVRNISIVYFSCQHSDKIKLLIKFKVL